MDDVQRALKERFASLHPLIFARSLPRAKTNGELFDILDSVPDRYPIVWDEDSRRWVRTDDLILSRKPE